MRPGLSENEAVGLASKVLYDLGFRIRRGRERHPVSAAIRIRMCFRIACCRPGDPVYYDILHSYMGYRTCYYRCFAISYASHALVDAYKRCREYLDAAISLVRPGRNHRGNRGGLAQSAGVRIPQ